jgi:hypothetical protein
MLEFSRNSSFQSTKVLWRKIENLEEIEEHYIFKKWYSLEASSSEDKIYAWLELKKDMGNFVNTSSYDTGSFYTNNIIFWNVEIFHKKN